MAEQQAERRRVVVDTPNTRREVEQSEAVRYPERSDVSGGVLAAVAVAVVALAAIAVLFLMNRQQDNTNLASQPPQTTIVEQPAQQPPNVVVQQPAPAAPVIVNNPAAPTSGGTVTKSGSDDATIQAAVDKTLSDDPRLSSLGITTMVMDGKVTLMGTVHSQALKTQVERAVKNVKGVKSVDNQISVM